MFLLHPPSPREVEAFLGASRDLPLSYHPVGLARDDAAGFALDEYTIELGRGDDTFERAAAALVAWKHFDLGWLRVSPPMAPIEPGSVVAVIIKHLSFWSLNGCRIVYTVGASRQTEYGFAYGTLTNHAAMGEEIFKVTRHPDSELVTYTIRVASRPRAALARLGYPLTRALQRRFRRDSAAALTRTLCSSR